MLSTLIERCGALIQSVMRGGTSAESRQDRRPSGGNPRGRHDAARRSAEAAQRNSDFQGEAPRALLQAYREATDDHGEEMRRRSFVI